MIADYKPGSAMHSTWSCTTSISWNVNYFVEQIILLPEIILLLSRKKLSHLIWKLMNFCIFFYMRIARTNLYKYYNSQCNNYQFSYSNSILLLVKRKSFIYVLLCYCVVIIIRNEDNYWSKSTIYNNCSYLIFRLHYF